MEVIANCKETLSRDDCDQELLQIIDGCDQNTIQGKKGSVLTNNCIAWRIDPEQDSDVKPPPTPPNYLKIKII
jgi:hypothetical protein